MILLLALVVGLVVGWSWARWNHQPYQLPRLQDIWLVFLAFPPQLLVAYLIPTRYLLPDRAASITLVFSLCLFLIFALLNRSLPGIPILLVGLVSNLIVILANGGWMPISPQTASHLINEKALQALIIGSRFGQKDILLLPQATHLEFLSDRFLLPAWFPYQVAFSLGDILISLGIIWFLAKPSNEIHRTEGIVI